MLLESNLVNVAHTLYRRTDLSQFTQSQSSLDRWRLRQAISRMRFRRPINTNLPGGSVKPSPVFVSDSLYKYKGPALFKKNSRGEVVLVEKSKSPSSTDRNQNYHRGDANTSFNLKILT